MAFISLGHSVPHFDLGEGPRDFFLQGLTDHKFNDGTIWNWNHLIWILRIPTWSTFGNLRFKSPKVADNDVVRICQLSRHDRQDHVEHFRREGLSDAELVTHFSDNLFLGKVCHIEFSFWEQVIEILTFLFDLSKLVSSIRFF